MSDGTALEVVIEKSANRIVAVTLDGIKCDVVDNEAKHSCRPGDRWRAEAIKGKAKGEKGRSSIRLVTQLSVGRLEAVPEHWMLKDTLEVIQALLDNGEHVLMFGPTGSGKSKFGPRFAKARGLAFHVAECQQLLTPRDLFGADAAVSGSTRFIPSAMVQYLDDAAAAYEKLGADFRGLTHLLLLDELNRAQGKAANGLLGLLGPERETIVPTVEGSRRVRLTPNVGVLSTANLGREYTGTSALDKALEDRHILVSIGYGPPDEISKLLKADPRFARIQLDDIRYIVVAAEELNRQYQGRQSIQHPPSFRGIEGALVLRGINWPLTKCIEWAFLQRMTEQERIDLLKALELKLAPKVKEAVLV